MFEAETNMINQFRRACDPFKGLRFKNFVGKLKDLPKDFKDKLLESGKWYEEDFSRYADVVVSATYPYRVM